MNFPENLKYSNDHEWISLDGDVATIGITEFAQGELGDIVFIDIGIQGVSMYRLIMVTRVIVGHVFAWNMVFIGTEDSYVQ